MALRSPLHEVHERLGGRFVEFAGFDMPVMYTSILDEHESVRTAAGLFDVSHMSNLWVPLAERDRLSRALLCDVAKVKEGGSKYACVLRDDGTILDDLYVFHLPSGYHLVPNAGRNTEVGARILEHGVRVEDASRTTAILAFQGPRAERVLSKVLGSDLSGAKKFRCVPLPSLGPRAFASRTGYTGEDGFELFLPNAEGVRLFPKILEAGREDGAAPCGLGARDTLRLEMGYCLAGHEFEGGRTPLEAGLDRLVDWDHEFSGRKALEAQRAAGDHDRLVGVRLDVRGIPRQGDPVEVSGRRVGTVTSGTLSPTLREGIALAYVRPPHADVDAAVSILIRGRPQPARVVSLPFVRSSS